MFEITLDAPSKNALGTASMASLLDRLREAAGRPVLLTGTGDAFSAGLDLKEVARLDGDAMLEFLRLLERCMASLYLYPGPTVALVNGHAIAGGCILAMCCDHRVAPAGAPRARIGVNEVALGVRFPPRTLAIVTRRVPARHLEEVVLGASLYDPAGALRVGLLDELADDAPAAARARLAALAKHDAGAYAATKRALRGDLAGLCPDDVAERALREVLPVWTSPALRARVAAMFAR